MMKIQMLLRKRSFMTALCLLSVAAISMVSLAKPVAYAPIHPKVATTAPVAVRCQGPNLIQNGGFEEGTNPGGFTTLQGGDSTTLPGWVVTHQTVDYIGSYFAPAEGHRSLDMDGTPGAGGVSQTFATTPGQTYTVTFDLADNPEGGPFTKTLQVTAAGQSVRFTHSGGLHWVRKTWHFTARDPQTTLAFSSMDPDRTGAEAGPLLDNVAVNQGSCATAIASGYTMPSANPGMPVATPFKACFVNSGSVASAGPCGGEPGTQISVAMSRALPSPPAQLLFKTVVTNGVPAQVFSPLSAGDNGMYTTPVPAQLCMTGSGGVWDIYLIDQNGNPWGDIGRFLINCPQQ